MDPADNGNADIDEPIGLLGVVHEVNSCKSRSRKFRSFGQLNNVNDARNSEFPIVTSEASFRARQGSVINSSKIIDTVHRTIMDVTTDPMPLSAEGRRKGCQDCVRKSKDLTTNADGSKSVIGKSILKSAWQTKGRKSQIKNV